MLLNDVKAALEAVDEHVYYGTGVSHPKALPWDYLVFSRDALRRKSNKSGYSWVLNVVIVREEYIPEGLEEQVVNAMEALPGVRMLEGEHEYSYGVKPKTNHTIEMAVLKFTYSRKL